MTTIVGETTRDVIASFMQQVIVEYQAFGEGVRRTEPRESVAVPVQVYPLNNELQPAGQPFQAVTRDISFGGMGIFHTQSLDVPYVSVEIAAPESYRTMRLLAKIEHCTRLGGCYVVGCRFAAVCHDEAEVEVEEEEVAAGQGG